MEHRIETLETKKLVGRRLIMNLGHNQTAELWRAFMPRRKEVTNSVGMELFSVEVYDPSLDFRAFSPDTEFEKWAAVEVSDFGAIPDQLEPLVLPEGLYVVFHYKGAANAFAKPFQYIFGDWLPNSSYELDARPHFEIMGEKYKGNDPDSEEEIWIPIKRRGPGRGIA
jgi:AraC family transcriptional regulator